MVEMLNYVVTRVEPVEKQYRDRCFSKEFWLKNIIFGNIQKKIIKTKI